MNKGDIGLLPFPFTNFAGIKNRPSLILLRTGSNIIASFITSQVKWQEEFDISLEPTKENGLKKLSLLRLSKLMTLDQDLVIGKLGNLTDREIKRVNENLKKMLKLE